MLAEMTRVRVIGLKSDLEIALETLQEFGRVHLEDVSGRIESGELPIARMSVAGDAAQQRTDLVTQQQRTRAIMKGLFGDPNIAPSRASTEADETSVRGEVMSNAALVDRCERFLGDTGATAETLVAQREALSSEQSELGRYAPMLEKVEPMVTELLETRDDFDAIALIVEKRYKPALNDLRDELTRLTKAQSVLIVEPKSEETVAAVAAFPTTVSPAVHALITDENVSQIALPKRYKDVPLPDALTTMRERITALPAEVSAVDDEIKQFATQHRDTLTTLRDTLNDRLRQLDLYETFGETDYTFVISGYVPSAETTAMRTLLETRCGPDVVVEEIALEPDVYSEVPVKMQNSSRLKPFEQAVGVWGVPQYGSIDPTAILSWTFPFLFGMTVGDFGYGSLILAVCIFLRLRFRNNAAAKAYTGLMLPTALFTMGFGLLYWELFGDLAILYVPGLKEVTPIAFGDGFSLPFIRTSASLLPTFLLMALGVGVIHVLFGLILGYRSAKRSGQRSLEREKLGLVALTIGAIMLVATMFVPPLAALDGGAGTAVKIICYLVMAAGFAIALWGGGVMGAIEAVETVSHMASYIRIMAVGLVGALLADASNKLAFVTMPNAIGAFIAIVLHVLNFAIILFSPAIHALRLNFLEFFGKFFERGNVLYRPFVRSAEKGMT